MPAASPEPATPETEPTPTPPWTRLVPPAALLAAVVAFTVAWTWVGWERYQSLHLSVYDFGLIYQEIWATAHGQSVFLLGAGAVHPLVLGFVPFLGLFPSQSSFFLLLLAANSAAVALGAVPLYLLVRDAYRNDWLALGLAGAYLAFPAVAGSVWFPVHLESFFPVLFLTGYWLYRRNSWRWACLAWTFALVTNVGAPVILAVFAVGMLVEPWVAHAGWWERLRGRPPPEKGSIPRRRLWLAGYLLLASGVVFLGISLALSAYEGYSGFLNFLLQSNEPSSSVSGGGTAPLATLGRQAMTFALLFGPLLGLPFLGREERWAMLPFFAHAFVVGNPGPFLWPFKDQYFCYVLPGLFASTVRGLGRPWRFLDSKAGSLPTPSARTATIGHRFRSPASRWGWGSVLAIVLVGLLFAPWGPGNAALSSGLLAQGYYDFPSETTANLTAVDSVRSLIAITPGQGTLLVQNNLVEPLDRFHYVIPGYLAAHEPVSYVLTDPYDRTFYDANRFGPYPATMLAWANYYLATGAVPLGEADGALLLSVNGSQNPPVYAPIRQGLGPAAFPCCGAKNLSNAISPTPLVAGPSLPFDGNYTVWSPGNYTLSLAFERDRVNLSDELSVQVSYDGGRSPFANFSVTGATMAPGMVVVVSFPLHIPVYLPGMHISVTVQQWSGSIAFQDVWLNQTAPIGKESLGAPWSTPP